MQGSALYYPYIDVRDPSWLRSAILFWDEIQTIVPSSISEPYHSEDTRICEQEGYLRALKCDFHPLLLEELGKRVVALIERPNWLTELYGHRAGRDPTVQALKSTDLVSRDVRRELHQVGIYPEKMSPELRSLLVERGLGQIHRDKLPLGLKQVFERSDLAHIHPAKLSREVKRLLGYRDEYEGEWLIVDSRFANAYMAALAAILAKQNGLSPLTSEDSYH